MATSSRFVDSHEDRGQQDGAQKAEHRRPRTAERDLEDGQGLGDNHNHSVPK
jgi:hypothetical protein